MIKMKALTILQPWASLIAAGAKKIETRSWATKYRGPIAIHAGKALPQIGYDMLCDGPAEEILRNEIIEYGKVIAIAELVDCIEMTDKWIANLPSLEFDFGFYDAGRYAWILENVRPIEPIPAKGKQRLWEWEGEQQ